MEDCHELRLVPEDELLFGNIDQPYVLTTITKTTKQGLLWIVKTGDKEYHYRISKADYLKSKCRKIFRLICTNKACKATATLVPTLQEIIVDTVSPSGNLIYKINER